MFTSGREDRPNLDILSLEEGVMRAGRWEANDQPRRDGRHEPEKDLFHELATHTRGIRGWIDCRNVRIE